MAYGVLIDTAVGVSLRRGGETVVPLEITDLVFTTGLVVGV
jgi:hypothetical protein